MSKLEALNAMPAGIIALALVGELTQGQTGDPLVGVEHRVPWEPAGADPERWVVAPGISVEEAGLTSDLRSDRVLLAEVEDRPSDGWSWRRLATSLFPNSRGMTIEEREAYRRTRHRLSRPL